jgi:hypothetical protein
MQAFQKNGEGIVKRERVRGADPAALAYFFGCGNSDAYRFSAQLHQNFIKTGVIVKSA